MKLIKDAKVKGKKVIVRVDFNVSMDKRGKILDDFRIKESLATIDYLRKNKAKIILMSHLGRPHFQSLADKKRLSLEPIAKYLKRKFKTPIKYINQCVGVEVQNKVDLLKDSEILLLENLRFHAEEEKNDEEFSRQLASLADIYINDAFGASHREHASVVGITSFLPSYAGFLLEKEIKILSQAMKNPKRPAVAVLGGVKLETKLPLINSLANKYDWILVGGRLGLELSGNNKKIIIPVDYHGKDSYDIGNKTIAVFNEIIKKAKTIIWNGPMGMFEDKKFGKGTKSVGQLIARSKAFTIAGGGDTIAALTKYRLLKKMNFVSTGGGAMLELLSGQKLAGIEALKKMPERRQKIEVLI